MAKRNKTTDYNVRIIDNGDGTYQLGHISRFKVFTPYKKVYGIKICGEWVKGNPRKMIAILTKGTLSQ